MRLLTPALARPRLKSSRLHGCLAPGPAPWRNAEGATRVQWIATMRFEAKTFGIEILDVKSFVAASFFGCPESAIRGRAVWLFVV